jgi:hypothetical protein
MSQNDTWTVVNQPAQIQIISEPAQNQGFTTKQPERITLEPTEIANVPAETQGITNRPLINKPSIVTKDTT